MNAQDMLYGDDRDWLRFFLQESERDYQDLTNGTKTMRSDFGVWLRVFMDLPHLRHGTGIRGGRSFTISR
jgi:hypothetical protein